MTENCLNLRTANTLNGERILKHTWRYKVAKVNKNLPLMVLTSISWVLICTAQKNVFQETIYTHGLRSNYNQHNGVTFLGRVLWIDFISMKHEVFLDLYRHRLIVAPVSHCSLWEKLLLLFIVVPYSCMKCFKLLIGNIDDACRTIYQLDWCWFLLWCAQKMCKIKL